MNKLIVVTGGTKGIGRAVIERFAAEHFDIVTCSRTGGDLDDLRSQLSKQYPNLQVVTHVVDMSRKSDVLAFGAAIARSGRAVDVLVNNAGFFIPGEITTEDDGVLEKMIEANLYSAYHTTRALSGGMKKERKGHIFNICSIASIMAYPNGGSYAISKAAMLGFSKCLREEVKTYGIRVTAVLPGATLTDSWKGSGLPDERFMKPEDVAETIFAAWKLSEKSVVEEILIRPQLGDI